MIKVTRNPDGTWWTTNRVYVGEDAKILDKLFGEEEDEMMTEQEMPEELWVSKPYEYRDELYFEATDHVFHEATLYVRAALTHKDEWRDIDWPKIKDILRHARVKNESCSLELNNWIVVNEPTDTPNTSNPIASKIDKSIEERKEKEKTAKCKECADTGVKIDAGVGYYDESPCDCSKALEALKRVKSRMLSGRSNTWSLDDLETIRAALTHKDEWRDIDWPKIKDILRHARAKNESYSLELNNWIVVNEPTEDNQ